MAAYATFTKFNGSWAIRVEGPIKAGETVQTRKSSGEVKTVEVTAVHKTYQGVSICAFRDTSERSPSPRSNASHGKAYGRSSAKSKRRSEGVTTSDIQTVREGQGGDTLGRKTFVNIRGVRTPCVVIGWDTRYVREDGLSFGMPADEGWFTTSYLRLATPDEAAEMIAADNARKEALANQAAAKKAAEEAARATARAPLEGLDHCNFLPAPTGTREVIGHYEGGSVVKITREDGLVAYAEDTHSFDDYRTTVYGTPEVIATLREELRNTRPDTYTQESAAEFLNKYRGCVGTGFYEWILSREA